MTVPILRKTAILIFFCNIVISSQDFLQYYQPRPGLPKPLNDWLALVQEHKRDFQIINNIVRRRKEDQDYYEEKEEIKRSGILDSQEEEYVDEAPHNDIHPQNHQEKKTNPYRNFETKYDEQENIAKLHKNQIKSNSQSRTRRESSRNSFFEKNKSLAVVPNGKQGEIKRSEDKYPEKFKNQNKDDFEKREVQIDVLNDGKLIKSIKESDRDSKSIVFNIEALKDKKNVVLVNSLPTEKTNNLQIIDTPLKLYSLQRSVDLDIPQNMNQEKAMNYNNLYSVNENLNTDSSVSKDTLDNNVLMYHVTLSEPNLMIQQLPDLQNITENNFKHNNFKDTGNNFHPNNFKDTENNFQHNNFKDMSKYWTALEKHQLQKGIQFAHNTINFKKLPQNIPKTNSKLADGFEFAKSVVVEHKSDKNRPQKLIAQQYQPQIKRNLQALEGTVQIKKKMDSNISKANMGPIELEIQNDAEKFLLIPSTEENVNIDVHEHKDDMQEENNTPNKELEHEGENQQELFHHHQNLEPEHIQVHKGDEKINNHIDITIIEPQKEEKTNRETSEAKDTDNNEDKVENNSADSQTGIELEEELNNEEQSHKILSNEETPASEEKIHRNLNEEEADKGLSDETEIFKEYDEPKNIESKKPECIGKENQQENNPEIEPNSHQYKESHYEKEINKNGKIKKRPHIRLQVDISDSNDKKRYSSNTVSNNLSKRYVSNMQRNRRPFYCKGQNCDGQLKKIKSTRHKNNKHRKRKHQYKSEYADNKNNVRYYKSRQLKSVDYVYDTDLEAPNDESYAEDQVSSERTRLLEINKKNAVEGDYGDEEDSISLRSNDTSKIIKKTDNAFANPQTVATEDDDDDYYYDDSNQGKKVNHTKHVTHERKTKLHSGEQKSSFGQRRHKKVKPVSAPKKDTRNHKEGYKDTQSYIREPRDQASFQDFRQLPKFVIDDINNEENLRKRSLSGKKESLTNQFPLSSKDFFINKNAKRGDILNSDKYLLPPSSDKIDTGGSFRTIDNLIPTNNINFDRNSVSTLINFNDIPGMSVVTTAGTAPNTTVECEETQVSVGNMCENESFNQSRIGMTTILSIIPDVEEEMNGNETHPSPNEKFEKLDEMLTGKLPIDLVSSIYDHMKTHPTFKTRFYGGMRRRHTKLSTDNIQADNQRESIQLVNIMENVINKLQWNTNCQKLPPKNRQYLKSITKVKSQDALSKTKQMEEVDFDDSQNTQNFIFSASSGGDAIEQKTKVLKDMLDRFEELPDNCKTRAEPVKKYIENHLKMLGRANNLQSRGSPNLDLKKETKEEAGVQAQQQLIRRDESKGEKDLVEEQLESVGLGKSHNFKPNFDLDDMVHNSRRNIKEQGAEGTTGNTKSAKKTKKRELDREVSGKYEKLLEAVKKERIKREGKRRLAESFGKLSVEDYNGENSNNAVKGVFESPLVYVL